MSINKTDLNISQQELNSIDDFRKSQDTAVLTVMFTDIQGYTRLTETEGEVYSAELRKHHDDILKREVEKNNRGLIVKFIGDAVMAVFAEPSSAVETALDIQQSLKEFNTRNTQLHDINVRIGLHMGQVSVENNIQIDIFGRHVNRAARIEGLAEGGQILMSYSVFDSAQGWLSSRANIGWELHGDYALKGIDGTTSVYEVLDKNYKTTAKAPKGAIKTSAKVFPKTLVAGLLVLIGAATAFFALRYNFNTEVSFRDFSAQDVVLDNERSLILDGFPADRMRGVVGDPIRKALIEIPRGKHVIHYDVHAGTRYYAEFEVESGENFIKPFFYESRLPALNVRFELEDGQLEGNNEKIEQFTFIEYKDGEKITHEAEIQLRVSSKLESAEAKDVMHRVDWKIVLDGKTVSEDSLLKRHPVTERDSQRGKSTEKLYADEFHDYTYRYYTSMKMMDFTLQSYFLNPSFKHRDQ